jgi:hypothetical protein
MEKTRNSVVGIAYVLYARWSGVRMPVETNIFPDPELLDQFWDPPSSGLVTLLFPGWSNRGVKWSSSLQRVPSLSMSGALHACSHIWFYRVDKEACTITGKTFRNSFFLACKGKTQAKHANWLKADEITIYGRPIVNLWVRYSLLVVVKWKVDGREVLCDVLYKKWEKWNSTEFVGWGRGRNMSSGSQRGLFLSHICALFCDTVVVTDNF